MLYNLADDLGETKDLAAVHPKLVAQAIAMMDAARTPDPDWPDPATAAPKKRGGGKK